MKILGGCFIVLFFLVGKQCYGVPKVIFNSSVIKDLSELWNIQIINDNNSPEIVSVRVVAISFNGTEVYEAESSNFLLQPGVFSFNNNQINSVTTKYVSNDFELLNSNQQLSVTFYIKDPINNIDLSQFDQSVFYSKVPTENQTDTSDSKHPKREKMKKYFDIGGNVELTGLYNTRKDTLFYLPTDYFRFKSHTNVSIADVPFTYDMYITTEQKYTSQKLNSYSFKFDVQTFKKNLIAKVSKKLEAITKVGSIDKFVSDPTAIKNFNPNVILDSLKNKKILSPEMITKYKEHASIDSLKTYLNMKDDISFKKNIAQIEKTIGKLDSAQIDSLYSKLNKADTLLSKADSVMKQLLATYQKINDWYAKGKGGVTHLMNKINGYSLDDIGAFNQIKTTVEQKVKEYVKQINLKELDKIKKFNIGDFNQFSSVSSIYNLLGKQNILNKKEQLLNNIRILDIGTVYPYYTNYSINGVILNGYNLAYNYKKFYIGSTGGKQINVFTDSLLRGNNLKKSLLFGFVTGYGDKGSNHAHINYQFGQRVIENSIDVSKVTIVNHVITPDIQYSLFKNKVLFSVESPISITISNRHDTLGANKVKTIGFANAAKLLVKVGKGTSLEFRNEYVNKNYTSFGVPFIVKNYLESSAKATQKIKDFLVVNVGYKMEDYFKTAETGSQKTMIHSLIADAQITYKVLHITVSYTPDWVIPSERHSTATAGFLNNVTVSLSANYKIKKVKSISQVGVNYNSFFNRQSIVTETGIITVQNDVYTLYKSLNVYATQSLTFKEKHTINTNLSLINNNFFHAVNKNIIILGLNYTDFITPKIRYSMLFQLTDDISNSTRITLQTSCNYRINKFLELSTKLQYDYLKGIVKEIDYNTHGFQGIIGVLVRY